MIQMRLLGVLRDRTPAMNELARFPDRDKSSFTGLIDRAQRRGLIVCVPSMSDRWAVLVGVSDHGRSLVSGGAARFDADISLLLEHLPPPDRDALSRLISQLLVAHAADQGIDLLATINPENQASGTTGHRPRE
jgi:MarR family transcriptional regulator, lower aerobic nicotinate degradation pathway regulator